MKIITKQQAIDQFNIREYDTLGSVGYDAIVLHDGEIVIEGDLIDATINDIFFEGNRKTDSELIIVNGKLTVNGDINISGDNGYPSLLVLGDVSCNVLKSYDNLTYITGDAYIKHVLYGYYNEGEITIKGTTNTPYFINSDHMSRVGVAKDTVKINIYNNEEKEFYDYTRDQLENAFVKEVFSGDENNLRFDVDYLIERLKLGKIVLK